MWGLNRKSADLRVYLESSSYVFRVRDSLGIGQGEVHAYKVHAKGQLIFALLARVLVPFYSVVNCLCL